MAFDYARLTEITTIADSVGVVYTNPADTTTYVRLIVIHNGNSSTEDVLLYNVPDNAAAVGTAGDTNVFYAETIAVNGTTIIDLGSPGIILTDENDTIQADTETASKVTIQIMGGIE